MIPDREENPEGLHARYQVLKADMSPANGEYFVLRLDSGCKDRHHLAACRKAAMTYADEIETHQPRLAAGIRERWGGDPAQ